MTLYGGNMVRSARTRLAAIDKIIANKQREIAELEASKPALQTIIDSAPAPKARKPKGDDSAAA